MSDQSTNIAVFGIELTPEQAELIFKKYFNEEEELSHNKEDVITTEVSYMHHGKPVYRDRNMPQMLADGADGRIHNSIAYSEECDRHVIGIYLASRGYAYNDKLENYLNPSQKAKDNFDKYILPLLKEEGINTEPSIQMLTQIW